METRSRDEIVRNAKGREGRRGEGKGVEGSLGGKKRQQVRG